MGRTKGAKDLKPRKLRGGGERKEPPPKPYPPRQPKRPPRPPRSEKEVADRIRLGDAHRGQPGGPGRPVGSRDARIIISEFGQLTLAQIKAKAEDETVPIHDRAILVAWIRAQHDQRTFEGMLTRVYGAPVQVVEHTGADGGPIRSESAIAKVDAIVAQVRTLGTLGEK